MVEISKPRYEICGAVPRLLVGESDCLLFLLLFFAASCMQVARHCLSVLPVVVMIHASWPWRLSSPLLLRIRAFAFSSYPSFSLTSPCLCASTSASAFPLLEAHVCGWLHHTIVVVPPSNPTGWRTPRRKTSSTSNQVRLETGKTRGVNDEAKGFSITGC